MRYRLRTLLIAAMVIASVAAASARCLDSYWFSELTGGSLAVADLARQVSARLIALPIIFALADLVVCDNVPAARRWPNFWAIALIGYAIAILLCHEAVLFAQSARE